MGSQAEEVEVSEGWTQWCVQEEQAFLKGTWCIVLCVSWIPCNEMTHVPPRPSKHVHTNCMAAS